MRSRLLTVLRLLQRLTAVVAALLLVTFVGACLTAYLAISTPHLPLLRSALGRVGSLVEGQETTDLRVTMRVLPRDGQLAGAATLLPPTPDSARSRFYFLLNPGLHVRHARAADAQGNPVPISAYQAALMLVIVPAHPINPDDSIELTLDYDGKPWLDVLGGANLLNEREVLLNVDAFWYPVDAQSFFNADVTIRLPRSMTLVHNSPDATVEPRGDEQEVHWRSQRPIAGFSLVAGPYRLHERQAGSTTYRLMLADDVQLDSERVLSLMNDAHGVLTDRLGPSGFDAVTIFVSREFRRGFNDGSGLIGLSLRYFRTGDYSFGLIAHEIAHDWWGGTVTGGWLTPGHGAQWIVEGFAEFSSLVASEARFGSDAVTQRLLGEFFDPARQRAVAQMSVLDNALDEPRARDTIYRKGGYVTWMLRRVVGDEACFNALRELVARFRYRHATDADVEAVFKEVSGADLEPFFADWVRGDAVLDLSIDAVDTDHVKITNLGKAMLPGPLDVWTIPASGEPVRSLAALGEVISAPQDATVLVDPLLNWADVSRENNRFPRREDPLAVAVGHNAELAVAIGDPFAWGRAAIAHTGADGRPLHTWELSRGLLQSPQWAVDGQWLVASVSDRDDIVPKIVTLRTDNAQSTAGKGNSPAPSGNATIYATRDDRLTRIVSGKAASDLVKRPGMALDLPVPSPDGRLVAYVAARRNAIDLRLVEADGSHDRSLFTWDRDRMAIRWAPDGQHLYTIIGGDADWQIWEVAIASGQTRLLVHDAAAIGDLAVAADGKRIAFTAAGEADYPHTRRQLYVLDLDSRVVQTAEIPDNDLSGLDWETPATVVVVGTHQAAGQPVIYPRPRGLYRVTVADGTVDKLR